MNTLYEECPSCLADIGPDSKINQLVQLLNDYDQLLMEIAPFTYRDGRKAKALRERKAELFDEEKKPEEPFDAIAFFAKLDEVPYLQDVKRWITEELARPLEEVAAIAIDTPPVFTGVTEEGWKAFKPGRITGVAVRFHNGDVRCKAINLDDYDAPPLQGIPEQFV